MQTLSQGKCFQSFVGQQFLRKKIVIRNVNEQYAVSNWLLVFTLYIQ